MGIPKQAEKQVHGVLQGTPRGDRHNEASDDFGLETQTDCNRAACHETDYELMVLLREAELV
jgi:hypothetical protein